MEYPLAERELRRLAQRPMTFVSRAALALAACPILSFYFLIDTASGGQAAQADEIAATLHGIGLVYLFFASLLLPPFLTSGLIASEKHERTLGTLLIADFSASDVILSKFVPTLLEIELLVLGSLPVLAFATVLGGITPSDLVLSVLLFCLSALMVSSIGLFASTISRQPGGAMMATVTILAVPLALDLSAQLFPLIPLPVDPVDLPTLMPAVAALQVDPMSPSGFWIPSATIALVASLFFVAASILLLPRQVYASELKAAGRFVPTFRRPVNPFLRERGTSLLFSRAAGGLSSAVRSTLLKIVFGIALALIALIPCAGILFVAGVVMFDVASTMDNAKRSGVLDDIRLSAPDPNRFLWDIYYALWMRGWFYIPGIVCGTAFAFGGIIFSGSAPPGPGMGETTAYAAAMVAGALLIGTAQLALMTAIGCYRSGYGRNLRSQTLTCVVLYAVVSLVSSFGIAIGGYIVNLVGLTVGGGIVERLAGAAVLFVVFLAALALWTIGFYHSYKTRHLKYV